MAGEASDLLAALLDLAALPTACCLDQHMLAG